MVTPDIHGLLGVGEPQFDNPATARLAEAILSHNREFCVTGLVITWPKTGERAVIENGSVRWLGQQDWQALASPPGPSAHFRIAYEPIPMP